MEDDKYLSRTDERKHHQDRKKQYKKIKGVLFWILPLALLVAVAVWIFTLPKKEGADVVARSGIHVHPTISIKIKGEEVTIPGRIGLGGIHRDIHTHEPDNTLHVEKSGTVRERDITVGNFFEIWGEEFSSTSILDNLNGPGGTVKMFVNGEENFEFKNYKMNDKDKIEIIYE